MPWPTASEFGDRDLQRRLGLRRELEVERGRPRAVAADTDRESALAAHGRTEERPAVPRGRDGRPRRRTRADEGVEQQRGIGDRAGQRTRGDQPRERVEPRLRGDAAARRLQPDQPRRGRRDANRPSAIRPGSERQEPRSDGDGCPAGGTAGTEGGVVRVAGDRAGEGFRVTRKAELGRRRLAEADATGVVEYEGQFVGCRGYVVGEGTRTVAGRHTRAGDEVFVAERQPPDRQGVRQLLHRGGSLPGELGGHLREGAEVGIQSFDTREVVVDEFERGHLAAAQPVELLESREVVQFEHGSSLTQRSKPAWLVTQVTNPPTTKTERGSHGRRSPDLPADR